MPASELDGAILVPALNMAIQLQQELARLRIASDVHNGYGLALVSVWVGLIVWCDGGRFWWRTGWEARRQRFIYDWHPSMEPSLAAHRIAFRYAQLRASHPLSTLVAEVQP
ncbi:hypothetical protein AB0I81_13005 [Nonomuraea sp. NPDC050404]|uniref:hypothetical protein n=1 Tax=Nonomuraea sp. NPDC050404 TaxID=3155783 RepID=UPI0033DBD8DD